MNKSEILSALDEEISRLRQARELLAETTLAGRPVHAGGGPEVRRGPGRPKGSGAKPASAVPAKSSAAPRARLGAEGRGSSRTMSPEGKARIAAAQRARWARQKETNKAAVPNAAPARKSGTKDATNKKKTQTRPDVSTPPAKRLTGHKTGGNGAGTKTPAKKDPGKPKASASAEVTTKA